MATKLQVTELDFDDIKTNLKTFMKNQTEFSDYNFEGSGLTAIIDLLAYNTHYLAMNANLAINEAFLDTATLRSSVVSHAKSLGYTPRSARSPVAYLDITLDNSTVPSATITKGTKFTTKLDGTTFGFVVNDDVTVVPINGVLRFSNLPVYEGSLVTAKYTVDAANADKKYIITDSRADTTTLRVSVQNSSSDSITTVYTLATDIAQVSATSKVYFLQETEDGKYEVYFGDNVVGFAPSDGNIIILEYIVTNKAASNGAKSFSGTSVAGQTNLTISTIVIASGGADAESIQSIKYNAPLDYSSQGRAVTTSDYKTIVPKVYADAKSVQVWGGEDNDPPVYGQVYISIKTTSGAILTQAQKNSIARSLDRYNIASVRPTIVDPELTKIKLTISFKYDSNTTTKTASDLETLVRTTLSTYNSSDLEKFDGVFRYSKVSRLIDATDPSILSNITTVRITKTIVPTLNATQQYIVKFSNVLYHPHDGHNAAQGGIVSTTGFTITGDTTNTWYMDDDGSGNLRIYYLTSGSTRTYQTTSVGTINYSVGTLTISSLSIVSSANSSGIIITVVPNSNDIVPVRNQLIEIDLANTSVIGANDIIESGGSSAGTGYTTTSSY
jgi:hypothetical protein